MDVARNKIPGLAEKVAHRSVSVVIPNFNGRMLLPKCLPPLLACLAETNAAWEVIVADDASTDDSIDFLCKTFPQLTILTSPQNTGFSATMNRGILAAQYDLVFALNNDVLLKPGYLIPQFRYFNDPDTFGTNGYMLDADGKKLTDGARYPAQRRIKIKSTINYEPIRMEKDAVLPTYQLSGANALYHREKLLLIGGFDEVYSPFYAEDLDLSLKAWQMGWNCYCEPTSVCVHLGSATIQSHHKREKIRTISSRNTFILRYIHLGGWERTLWYVLVPLEILFRWLGKHWHYYRALREFTGMFPRVHKSEQKFRTVWKKSPQRLTLRNAEKKIREMIGKRPLKFW